MQTLTQQIVKCDSCGERRPEADLSECTTCAAKFCGSCSQCDCDRLAEMTQDLLALANSTGQHRELLRPWLLSGEPGSRHHGERGGRGLLSGRAEVARGA